MKNLQLFLQAILVLIFFSCNNPDENHLEKNFSLDSFPIRENLKSQKFVFDDILNPSIIKIKNGKLIIGESHRGTTSNDRMLIHLIRKDDMSYLHATGLQGYGPGRIISIRSFDDGWTDSTFWAYDIMEKKFHEYSLNNSHPTSINTFKQNEQSFFAVSWNWLTTDSFIGRMMNDSHAFSVFDTTNLLQRKIAPWSEDKDVDETTGYLLGNIHQGHTAYHQDKKLIIHAQINSDIIEIIPIDNPTKKITITGPISEALKYEIRGSGRNIGVDINGENTLAYNNLFLGKDSMFLVYLGFKRNDPNQNGKMSNEIFELDYEGNPKAYYILDREIQTIAVDEENRKIYAVTFDGDPGIAIFEY